MRILLVEDDVIAAEGLSRTLKSGETIVDRAHTGEEALDLMGCNTYDIAVIDLMLPDIEGYDVIRSMRKRGNHVPVLIMSGLCRPEAKVKGLGAGADDFITKPFDKDELLARVHAVVRRGRGASRPPVLRIGAMTLDPDTREVAMGDVPIAITGREYAVLELLVLRKGMVLTKEALSAHLYDGMDVPQIKIIDVFVCKLRKKLAEAGAGNPITTVWGRGYMIDGPSNGPLEIDGTMVTVTPSRRPRRQQIGPQRRSEP